MAKPLEPLPAIVAGDMDSIMQFLQFLKEPEKYKKRLDDLEAMRKEINDLIETHGKVQEIEKLRSEATVNHEVAERMLLEAKALRERTSEECEAMRREVRAELSELRSKADEALIEREDALRKGEAELDRGKNQFASEQREMKSREDRAAAQERDALMLRARYERGLVALKEAVEAVNRAL